MKNGDSMKKHDKHDPVAVLEFIILTVGMAFIIPIPMLLFLIGKHDWIMTSVLIGLTIIVVDFGISQDI